MSLFDRALLLWQEYIGKILSDLSCAINGGTNRVLLTLLNGHVYFFFRNR